MGYALSDSEPGIIRPIAQQNTPAKQMESLAFLKLAGIRVWLGVYEFTS